MNAIDEDSPLCMLASAWTNLSLGGAKGAQDAAYIYDELVDKYGGSALLLNGLAVAKMHQGQYEEAESYLQEALTKVRGKEWVGVGVWVWMRVNVSVSV